MESSQHMHIGDLKCAPYNKMDITTALLTVLLVLIERWQLKIFREPKALGALAILYLTSQVVS